MRRTTLAFTVLALAGCIEEAPLAHQGTPRAAQSASPAAPTPAPTPEPTSAPVQPASPVSQPSPASGSATARPAGAVFDDALQVVAYRVDPPTAAPGQTVTIDVALRALKPIPVDQQMFVHVDDSSGRSVRVNGDHWPAGHRLPMPQWKVGETIPDRFQVTLGGFEESSSATVWLGFWDPEHDTRMTITNAGQVKTDGNNRYALTDIPISH